LERNAAAASKLIVSGNRMRLSAGCTLLGEAATATQHAIADLPSPDVGAELRDLSGDLAAGDERRWRLDVILAGDAQHVGVAHGARRRSLTSVGRVATDRLDHQIGRPAVGFPHHDTHRSRSPKAFKIWG
jgi:hypothetical protein